MLANLRIRWKLVAIFLLPALTLSTVAVTRIVSTLSDGFQADRELRSLQFSTRVAALAGELQGERTLSTQWAGTGKAQGGEELTTQRARVDRALADLRANAEELGPELGGARVTKAWQTAQERLEALVTHRRSLDRFPSTPAEAQTVFTAAVTDLLSLNAAIAAEASDPDVLRTASSYVAVTSMKEFAGQQRDLGLEAILARTFAQGGRERLTSAIAAEIAWVKRFQATASDAQWTQLATRISSPDVAEAGRLRSALLSEARQGRITADGRTWLTATAARQDALRQEESALAADVLAANRAVAVRMKQRLINDILITLFVLALALGFAMNMARSMVRRWPGCATPPTTSPSGACPRSSSGWPARSGSTPRPRRSRSGPRPATRSATSPARSSPPTRSRSRSPPSRPPCASRSATCSSTWPAARRA